MCLKSLVIGAAVLAASFLQPALAQDSGREYTVGAYLGQFYASSPEELLSAQRAGFKNHYLGALSLSKTVWQSEKYPLALEVEGVAALQAGQFSLGEVGVVPVLRWSGFPWNDRVPTSFRFGPVGVSWTSSLSPLEKNSRGGSQWLNFLIADLGFSLPDSRNDEIFLRLHHRCSLFNVLNGYGTNGEDFLAIGFRHRF